MNDKISLLSTLEENEGGIIISLDNRGMLRRRLQDMGFVKGSRIVCVGKSPFGDPKAYMIKDTVIALRNSDTEKINIKKI